MFIFLPMVPKLVTQSRFLEIMVKKNILLKFLDEVSLISAVEQEQYITVLALLN